MDADRFDEAVRLLVVVPSRRGMLGLALGGALHFLLSVAEGAAKKRKRRNKKKKRKCLFGQRRCRDKRCHGCCSNADCGGNVCETGTCSDCPRGKRLCRDGCIPKEACCTDSDCDGAETCVAGVCGCRAHERLCEGACIPNDACCGADCPPPACSSDNCPGCCHGDTCHEGVSQRFCGHNGAVCIECPANTSCDGETCVCPTQCCSNADCTAAPGGICQANGFCQYPCIETGQPCSSLANCCDPNAHCDSGVCGICIASGDECDPGGIPCCSGGVCDQVGEETFECFV